MTERKAVGIDIGGTKIALVLANHNGDVLGEHRIPFEKSIDPTLSIRSIGAAVKQILHDSQTSLAEIDGIGIGTPGWVDSDNGIVRNAVNLGWQNVPLAATLQTSLETSLPVYVEMDVRAALSGELVFGAARGLQDVVMLAIGTGLGAAAVVSGTLVRGADAFAMELGHVHVPGFQRACSCGGKGCVETILSGKGIIAGVQAYRDQFRATSALANHEDPTPHDWLNALHHSDPLANHILEDARAILRFVLDIARMSFNPMAIIIGGGLGLAASDYLLEGLETGMSSAPYCPLKTSTTFRLSTVTNSALGGASLVWQHQAE